MSCGEAEGESDGNSTHADEGEDDTYGEGNDRCGDRAVRGGGVDNDIDTLTYICIHKFYSSNCHIPVRAQAAATRAVPGRDLAGKKVHEEGVFQDDDDEEEEVVVHKRQDRKRKL